MIMLTSILAGVFIGAAILMLIFSLKNKKSATCGDDCGCKEEEDNCECAGYDGICRCGAENYENYLLKKTQKDTGLKREVD